MSLNQPLPPELTGRHHGWLTRYRRYPVFSSAWVRGRTKVSLVLGAAGLAPTLLPMAFAPREELPVGPLVHLLVQIFVPLLLGPWLGSWVRRQGWPAAREGLALVAMVLGVACAVLVFHRWAAELIKQKLAELTGDVDAPTTATPSKPSTPGRWTTCSSPSAMTPVASPCT